MHAEMTVGLDLCSLENLKIFNGHDVVKKEPRKKSLSDKQFGSLRSIESSPDYKPADSDSDEQQEQSLHRNKKGRQKCGRPANPIPRHKRQSHIKAEYKRRDKIQKGFDSLVYLVPELRDSTSSKESKSSLLFKAAEYCRRLKGESGNVQSEMAALRQELEALGTEIHDLQQRLPQQGLEVVEKDPVKMDSLYDQYVEVETKQNWKFWLFGFFMRPLYMSYRHAVSSASTRQEYSQSVSEWIQETLNLTNLRKGFFEALRKISITTGIMTCPEKLEEEARRSLGAHYVQRLPPASESEPLPSPKNPKSEVTTPIPSPKPSTPIPSPTTRSPAISRRPSTHSRTVKRESRKSKESRSRSSTPPMEEGRSKRRSSHNRGDRHAEQEGGHSGKRSRAASPRTLGMETPYSQPFLVPATSATARFTPVSVQNGFIPIQLSPQATVCISPQAGVTISPQAGVAEKDLVKALKSLLHRTPAVVKSQPSVVSANDCMTSDMEVMPTYTKSSSQLSQPLVVRELSTSEPMEMQHLPCPVPVQSSQTSQSFMPIEQSGIITNSTLLTLDHTMSDSFNTPAVPDLQALINEDSMSCQSSLPLYQLSTAVMTTAQPIISVPQPRLSSSTTGESVGVDTQHAQVNTTESAFPFNSDEDSLMNMLTVDVMDINSVLTFFTDENKAS